jgi:membrane protease YdiL (CAAX protease family)
VKPIILFRRFAALAEILTILVLGNLAGLGAYQLLEPTAVVQGTASPELVAACEGLLIFLRLGSAAVFGYGLLYYRRGLTPRQAGLTRNQRDLGELIRTGVLLGVFTTIPISLLFAAHELLPFGDGLDAWWSYRNQDINTAFWINILATSVLVPPLVEEILTRGYQRVRLIESYGMMGGVVLTGLVFALSHTRYLAPDPMLLLFLLTIVISSISWTYLAEKTGSVIPSMVAHAVTNGTASAILFDVWIPMIALLIIAVVLWRPIVRTAREFYDDWIKDVERSSLWTGLAGLIVIAVPALAALPVFGRVPTLAGVGAILLVFSAINLYLEKVGRIHEATNRTGR